MLAARRLAVLLGLTAILALPTAGGAAAPTGGEAAQRQRDTTSLAAKERAAAQELYSLEAQLAVAQSRLASLTTEREAAEARLTRIRIELDVAWQSAYIAEERLGARIRQLYQQGALDPVAILLGAESLDEAIGGLDGLRSFASGDQDILRKVRQARADLSSAKRRVAARAAALRQAEDAAERTAASLAAARADRKAYLAALPRQRGFTTKRVARVRSTVRTAVERTEALEAWQPSAKPVPEYAGLEQTMTVSTTGYALRGRTASGLPTGWGIVAVDPSVIPLGTRITIPGYGEGVAADTGGSVHGATIDLWFPTAALALAWGRRTVTITLHGG
jgi:3D (Asp-Asp-Asp) domain-containing protein/septal ring factor EnvC (AmiA/AmiB activator)